MENIFEIPEIILEAEKKGIIKLDKEKNLITYTQQKTKRNFNNPEERVQAEAYSKLVLQYNYKPENIGLYVNITTGSSVKQADIIVYNDAEHTLPYIVVECKKDTVTELEFDQAINQAYSYAHMTAGTLKYIWTTSGIKNAYFKYNKESNARETVSDIPQYGVKKLSAYKYAYNGGTTRDGQKLFPLKKVSENELTNIFKSAHQALWGGGELNPSEAFDELDKLIFCKIFDEREYRAPGDRYEFQVITVEPKDNTDSAKEKAERDTNEDLLKRIKKLYEKGRQVDAEVFKDNIKLDAQKTRTVVGYLEGINLSETDLDSKGRAFETFMGSFFRGDFGQYFTPRKIVEFIVDSLPITKDDKVLDTSCGSGGFLLHALDKVRKAATELDPNYMCSTAQYQRWHDYWHRFAENNLYGIEINEQIARTAKMNMIIHDDGHTNVVSADGLLPPSEIRSKTGNPNFVEGTFKYIITNPPFGSIIKQTEKSYMHQYSLATREVDWLNPASKAADRPSQSSEVLFIEQAETYLKDGGYIAVVVPDGLLTNSSLQYVRDYISETFRIIAVVSMPQTAFTANGAGVKSSVLFLKKYSEKEKEFHQNIKKSIQQDLLHETENGQQLFFLFDEKKAAIAKYNKLIKNAKNALESEQLKIKKQAIIDDFDEKIEKIQELLSDAFDELYEMKLINYPIFMAMAENIGYDATGKETPTNELEDISKELLKFINAIENEKDSFFS